MLLALTSYQIALLCTAATFIVFALVVSLVVSRSRPDFPGGRLAVFLGICVVLFAAQLTAVFVLAQYGEGKSAEAATTETSATTTETTAPTTTTGTTTGTTTTSTTTTQPTTTTTAAGGQGDPAAGKVVFTVTAGCKGCHTLKDAGATGTTGPNLDQLKPTYDRIVAQVTNGGAVMPAFKGTLTPQQIQDVAAYVSSVAGR